MRAKISLVILAGGKGTRFLPLTETMPKALLPVLNKPSLELSIEKVHQNFDEIILVIGYLGEKIKEYFGKSYKGTPIRYHTLKQITGSGQALHEVSDLVKTDKFVLMYGDDIYDSFLVEKLLEEPQCAVIGKRTENWQRFGVFQVDGDNFLQKIVEKPTEFVGDLVNIGLYKLDQKIFDCFFKIQKSVRDEYEFTDMLTLFAQDHQVKVIETDTGWYPLSYPSDLLSVNQQKLSGLKEDFLIGKDCKIGLDCEFKGFGVIGDNVKIGDHVLIENSIIGHGTRIESSSSVRNSIIIPPEKWSSDDV